MKYGIDMYDLVFPKYGKLVFGINKTGNFILNVSPSFTVGKLPEGVSGGRVPKGTKVFDYDKEVVVSFDLKDCLNMVEFFRKKDVSQNIDFYRNSERFNKKITLKYTPMDDDATKPKMVTIFVSASLFLNGENKEVSFYVPMSLANFGEMIEVVKSYINNFAMIKLFCLAEQE